MRDNPQSIVVLGGVIHSKTFPPASLDFLSHAVFESYIGQLFWQLSLNLGLFNVTYNYIQVMQSLDKILQKRCFAFFFTSNQVGYMVSIFF